MIVTFTFDSGITPTTWEVFQDIFNEPLRNPTGCNIGFTWFFTPMNSVGNLLQTYIQTYRFEVGLKSSDDGTAPPIDQIATARKRLADLGHIDEKSIIGWRSPKLQFSPSTFEFVSVLGFLYDSSITQQGPVKMFPYTLDYGVPSTCFTGQCDYRPGKGRYPGLWEIPIYTVNCISYRFQVLMIFVLV